MSELKSNQQQNLPTRSIYQNVKRLLPLSMRVFLASCRVALINRFAHLDRTLLSSKYLRGEGLEIGALHVPLTVSGAATVKYVDRLPLQELREMYPELQSYEIVEPDILDDGQNLGTIEDSSQDFVIANHFLEHCPNPLAALKNIHRVLRLGGVFFLALPDKRFTFDVDRAVTTFDHVLRDFEDGPEWSKQNHYEEWVSVVEKLSGQSAQEQIDNLMRKEAWIHFHVWTQREMFELLASARKKLGLSFEIECFLKSELECIFVLRKIAPVPEADGTSHLGSSSVRSEEDELIPNA